MIIEQFYIVHIGLARGCRGCTPRASKKILGIFVGMRQNGAEFGEVHPADEIKK